MRLGVVGGAGLLGSTTAFHVGLTGVFSEIILLDIKKNLAMCHAMDMDQALSCTSGTRVRAGEYSDLEKCDIILMSAGIAETAAASRNEYLRGNIEVVREICGQIAPYVQGKVIIDATNPVDVLNYISWKLLDCPREKILGFCLNDSVRFAWAAADVRCTSPNAVSALCVGEHGDGQVPILGSVTIDKKPAALTREEGARVVATVREWFGRYQELDGKRSSGWTSALGLGKMIMAVARDTKEVLPVSAVVSGEYGFSDISIGVPAHVGAAGITGYAPITDILPGEQAAFEAAAEKIRGLLESVGY